MSKCFRRLISLILVLFLLLPVALFADDTVGFEWSAEALTIDNAIDKTSFLGSETIQIQAPITGDVFVMGRYAEIEDDIDGDAFIFSQSSRITGHVHGNIFCMGDRVDFQGRAKSLYGFGNHLAFGANSKLDRDAFLAARSVSMKGEINRDGHIGADELMVNGIIGRHLYADAESTFGLGDKAEIGGDLTYKTSENNILSDADENKVKGVTTYKALSKPSERDTAPDIVGAILSVLWTFFSLLVMWGLVRFLNPGIWEKLTTPFMAKPLITGVIGLASLVLIPLSAIILMITVIGIPLGLAILLIAALFMVLSKVLFAVSITRFITGRADFERPLARGGIVVAVLLFISLTKIIPFVGGVITFLAFVLALGLLVMHVLSLAKSQTKAEIIS